MAHDVAWLIPNHVIVATLNGPIAADEVQIIADQMYEDIATIIDGSMVHTLIDVREATIQDKLWNYAKLNFRRHSTVGLSIVIGDSRLAGMVIAIFSKILNLHIRYSDTLENALKILGDRDTDVADYVEQHSL